MSKSVLMAGQPYWVFLIIARKMGWDIPQEKTIEVRKDCPKDKAWNERAHIYCSKNRKSFNRIPKQYQPLMEKYLGKIIGEFICDRIDEFNSEYYNDDTVYQDIRYLEPDDDEPDKFFWAHHILESNEDEDEKVNQSWLCKETCLTRDEIWKYVGIGFKTFYGWHISDLQIYDTPKELGEFKTVTRCKDWQCFETCSDECGYAENNQCHDGMVAKRITRPPQSWCYIEALQNGKI